MAIKFLSLLGFKSKCRKEQPEAAPEPKPPVPEVTAALSVKEEFHEEVASTAAGLFRFDSSRSELIASMTVSYDVQEITSEFNTDWRANCHIVETPVRIIHTSALVRLYRTRKDGENGGRAFVVCDRGGCFIDGTPATRREFFSLYEKAAQQTAALFRHGDVPYAFIDRYGLFDIVMNASIANITIHDEDALLSLVPIY